MFQSMVRGNAGGEGKSEARTWVSADEAAATSRVIGAAVAVHRSLGPGFGESVYHRALEREMELRGIPFASEIEVDVSYRGIVVGRHRLDMVASGGIVVELKAVHSLDPVHYSQVRSYLKATRLSIGLLLNFAATRLVIKRVILPEDPTQARSGLPSPPAFPRLPVHRARSDPPHASLG